MTTYSRRAIFPKIHEKLRLNAFIDQPRLNTEDIRRIFHIITHRLRFEPLFRYVRSE